MKQLRYFTLLSVIALLVLTSCAHCRHCAKGRKPESTKDSTAASIIAMEVYTWQDRMPKTDHDTASLHTRLTLTFSGPGVIREANAAAFIGKRQLQEVSRSWNSASPVGDSLRSGVNRSIDLVIKWNIQNCDSLQLKVFNPRDGNWMEQSVHPLTVY